MPATRKMQPQPWIKSRVRDLGKTLRGLGLAMGGLDGSRLTEIMAGTRRVKAAEVPAMATFLELSYDEVYRRLFGIPPESIPQSDGHGIATTGIDASSELLLIPFYEFTASGKGRGMALVRSPNWATVPQRLHLDKDAFAVPAWDDKNAPWIRRGSTLYINPARKPRTGDWGIFYQKADLEAGIIENPCVGILLAENATGWAVQIGMARIILDLADFPLNWFIEWIRF